MSAIEEHKNGKEEMDNGAASGDYVDSKGGSKSGGINLPPNMGFLQFGADEDEYKMDLPCKGKVVIFNNQHFEPYLKLGERRGTAEDRNRLVETFHNLGFQERDVKVYDDLRKSELDNVLLDMKMANYQDCACLIVCFLSHGDEGVLYSKDTKFPNHKLWEPFLGSECPTLAGKPKIFLIQACQGDRLDAGVDVIHTDATDGGYHTGVHRIPSYADFLIVYSTVPGHYSWRNTTNGSWFVQSLSAVLAEHGHDWDLLRVLTKVARRVAYSFMSNTPALPHMHMMKQVPCITSMLTRDLFLGGGGGGAKKY